MWEDIDLTEVTTGFELIPEGDNYVFTILPGAKPSKFDAERVEVPVAISTGEFAGRQLFLSYPDPKRPGCEWSPKAFKRLVEVLGVDVEKGETPLQILSKSAGLRFGAPIKHYQPKNETNDAPKRAEIALFKVRVAA
jgi:hypothetical protein